jgi:FkbM family methyltransferase
MKLFSNRPSPGGGDGRAHPDNGISAKDVIAGIEMILGYTPPRELVDYHLQLGFENRIALGAYLLSTAQFQQRYGHFGQTIRPASVFLGDRVLTTTHAGSQIYLDPADLDLTPRILFEGRWEPHVEDTILKLLQAGDIALDIGANVGYHTLAIANAVGSEGQVHAFEANPSAMRLLGPSVYVNGFAWVSLYGKAVLDRAGTITLACAPAHLGSGHVVLDPPYPGYAAKYSARVDVEAVTLDRELGDRLDKVALIHLDIEGAEPLALRGARGLIERSPGIRIVTEWSVGMMSNRIDVAEYVRWLVSFGFRFWRIGHGGELIPIDAEASLALPHCDLLLSRQEPV